MTENVKAKTNIPPTDMGSFLSETGYAMALRRIDELMDGHGEVRAMDRILIKVIEAHERNMIREPRD